MAVALGGVGIIGTQYISYKQYEKDCNEIFEQYKKHFEENKYLSLFNFIASLLIGIKYIENYILNCEENQNNENEAPNPEEVKEAVKGTIKNDYNDLKLKNNNIKNDDNFPAVPVLN